MVAVVGLPVTAEFAWAGRRSTSADMPTVYYGLAGEGLGHARRAAPILEHLCQRTRVVVLTSGQATELVRARFAKVGVEVRQVPGYRFEYNALSRLSIGATLLSAYRTAAQVDGVVRTLAAELARRPSIVVSDFEPITIRAAELAGAPSLSVDHQRFLQVCRFDETPSHVRLGAEVMRRVIDITHGTPHHLVVSGFFLPPAKPGFDHVKLAGVTIRDSLLTLGRRRDPYLVAYVRRSCPLEVERTLMRSPIPVFLYGLGERPSRGNIRYCKASDREFSERLSGCSAVVSTAGNQLIGEAFHLGKPVLAFPEPGNPEQHVNAALLNLSGGGLGCSHRALTHRVLEAFLQQRPSFERALLTLGAPGNATILRAVDEFLESALQGSATTRARARDYRTARDEPRLATRVNACA